MLLTLWMYSKAESQVTVNEIFSDDFLVQVGLHQVYYQMNSFMVMTDDLALVSESLGSENETLLMCQESRKNRRRCKWWLESLKMIRKSEKGVDSDNILC